MLLPHERQYAEYKFRILLAESSGTEFEKLFHRLMELRYDDYVPVRTHGNMGDLGADGLGLADRRLYACYGPEVGSRPKAVRTKFHKDLASALVQRPEQFDTFVFVHNNQQGVHPVVTGLLSEARGEYPALKFEQMGARKLWYAAMGFDRSPMETLLGTLIPIEEAAYKIGMADIEPLLKHLAALRGASSPLAELPLPTVHKADFNRLGPRARDDFQRARRFTSLISNYYRGDLDATERDEVADGFRIYYDILVAECEGDPDEILWRMQGFVLGQARTGSVARLDAADAVITYFFDECDIFEIPPDGWTPAADTGDVS